MFGWLTQRRMQGGLVFGPPGWMPERIEETFDGGPPPPGEGAAALKEADRAGLGALLERLMPGGGGTGGMVPGLAAQLKDLGERSLEGLVLNLLPAEPESALGAALSRLALEDLVAGLSAIERAVEPPRIIVALDRHDVRGWRNWRLATRVWRQGGGADTNGRRWRRPVLKMLLNRYPQANPTMLLWALRGIKLGVGALPTGGARRWLMVDAITCWGLGRHLRTGLPFADRPVQLFVQGEEPRLVMGRLGESLADFCARHGVKRDLGACQVIVNGMLAGWQVPAGKLRIDGRTESLALREPALPEASTPCISCGWCVDVCPSGLTPVSLMELARRAGLEESAPTLLASRAAREARHCIACGLCTYVCPTRLPLMEQVLELQGRLTGAKTGAKHDA